MATYDVKQIALPGGDIANLKDGNAIHKSNTSGFVKNDGSIDQNTYQIAQEGKGLSTNDYTTAEKDKVATIDNKADKVSSATNGNLAGLDGNGNLTDSGWNGAKDTTSISGNPISISGLKANQLAKNPIITLEPIQDLHGQSKPYPAGGGKNKLPMTVDGIKAANTSGIWSSNTYTQNNVAFTILTDSANNVIGINITANSSSDVTNLYIAKNISITSGSYILNGCPSGGGSSNYEIDADGIGTDKGSGKDITISGTFNLRIRIASNVTMSNKVFKPMVRLATETDATFAPYENICPISGYDKIEVLSCGKNLFDKDAITTGYRLNNTTGEPESDASYCISNFIRVKANTAYYVTATSNSRHWFYDVGKNPIETIGSDSAFTYTPTADGYIRISIYNYASKLPTMQITQSSTAQSYEPYHKTTDLSESLGQTVYGLTHEVRTGKAKVTKGAVDLGDLSWSYSSGMAVFYADLPSNTPEPKMGGYDAVCSIYACYTGSYSGQGDKTFTINNTSWESIKRVWIKDSSYTDPTVFKTAVTGQKLVYPLANPIEIQLTPHEISLLKDYAYVSTNGTSIALDYHNGELASLSDVSQLNETVELLNRPPVRKDSINIKDYTTENNAFTCPCDGYIFVRLPSGSGHVLMRLMDSLGNVVGTYTDAADAEEAKAYSVFVKRGIKTYAYCYVGETLAYTYWFYGIE